MSFREDVEADLRTLEEQGLRRFPRQVESVQAPRTSVDGRSVLCLCSNNYLGLSEHPALRRALSEGAATWGVGAAASRLISGTMSPHRAAEAALASWLERPRALLFSSGYAANVGVIQALLGPADVVFSDRLNHASLIDGARLSRAKVVIYDHCDSDDLARRLRTERGSGRRVLIATESLFSMDGDVAPLARLRALADEHGAGLLVDDAHALGVFGPGGRGLCAEHGIVPDLWVGTLGKALGLQGAFVAAEPALVDLIENRARSYVFSTASAPALAHATVAAVELAQKADFARAQLRRHFRRLRAGLRELGYVVLEGDSPIIPVMVGDPLPTMKLSQALLDRGVFVHGIRPPTVPPGTGRLRVVPMATHTDEDISQALAAFSEVRA